MSEEMKLSICKSAAYGETPEDTAKHHDCTVDEVLAIWSEMSDTVTEYRQFFAEMNIGGE